MTTVLNAETNELNNKENKVTDSKTTNVTTAMNDELTNKENTMTNEKLNNHITKMNEAIDVSINSNLSMFQVFMGAYNEYSKDIENYKIFKDGINLEQSTINKMEKICSSKAISDNADKLPISWGTLSAISSLKESQILEAINSNKFHRKTTKKEVTDYKHELKAKKYGTEGDALVQNERDTTDDATVKTASQILEDAFFEKLSSNFTERKAINDNAHKDIQKALKILNKYYEISSISTEKKVA